MSIAVSYILQCWRFTNAMIVLNLILLWQYQMISASGDSISVRAKADILTPCPYPLPEMIQPCKCFANQDYKGL